MKIPIVGDGAAQCELRLHQAERVGRRCRALLDTGSSRMIVRANVLPEVIEVEPKYDAYVHFLRDRIPARVVRRRARLQVGR